MPPVSAAAKILIGLDLDGTVIHDDESADADLTAALQCLDAAPHVEVVFATGRAIDAGVRVAEKLQLTPHWLVTCNGAVTLRRDPHTAKLQPYRVHTFNATEMLENVRQQLPGAAIAVEGADGNFYYTAEMPGKTLPDNRFEVSFEELLRVEATRVVATSPAHSVAEFFERMELLGYTHTAYVVGDTAWLDAAPNGINKASALAPIAAELGVPGEHVFVAGDGMNDLQMLSWAKERGGMAVAMGQAYSEVRDTASFVTGTIDEGGLLTALRHFKPIQDLLP